MYKRQAAGRAEGNKGLAGVRVRHRFQIVDRTEVSERAGAVSYTHLRAHETVLDLVCRLLLEKKTYDVKEKPNNMYKRHNAHTTYSKYYVILTNINKKTTRT